ISVCIYITTFELIRISTRTFNLHLQFLLDVSTKTEQYYKTLSLCLLELVRPYKKNGENAKCISSVVVL
ncbi:MAG: hypothetical protein ACKPKO_02020, partial [Candidatus Fonsibacter sp.]